MSICSTPVADAPGSPRVRQWANMPRPTHCTRGSTMLPVEWLEKKHENIVRNLADLVAIQSISTDGEHGPEIERTAALTCQQMRQAGLANVDVLRVGGSLPYAYGEWLEAPGKPTVFLYAHHDVQPTNYSE